ncbi:DUF3592 domain-containing protein [Marinobacter sp. CHS3-4]|uniref:DUF3592 domain-containing protein n=1 Tax=Marinobacter sp. CHS3-4 TaxID=3045174 RepID=UPI0024B4B24C|nr:DUF3592 domain-containing protein [Marinobacter sp. CHS3-4]MDI9246716.1 DUF3592 domain-containing protein [Marinobacter sp. CHS3-4]
MRVYDFLKYVFSVVGGALIIGALAAYQSTSGFLAEALEVPGVVTDLIYDRSGDSSVYYPIVQFKDATGQLIEFRSSSGSNPASHDRGETVSVFYTAGEPESARINGFFSLWGVPLIVGSLGGVFFLVGVLMILVPKLRSRRAAKLKATGRPISARIQSVELNTGMQMNGRSPYRIVSQWQDPATTKVHVFLSDNLWFNPTNFIKGESVSVYIQPDNPKRYWVDTSFLPKAV